MTHYAHPAMPQLEFCDRIAGWVAPGGTLLTVDHSHTHYGGGQSHGSRRHPPAEASATAAASRRVWTRRLGRGRRRSSRVLATQGADHAYLTGGMDLYEDLLARLGQHQTGKGCLYLKQVDHADPRILRDIVDRSYRTATEA